MQLQTMYYILMIVLVSLYQASCYIDKNNYKDLINNQEFASIAKRNHVFAAEYDQYVSITNNMLHNSNLFIVDDNTPAIANHTPLSHSIVTDSTTDTSIAIKKKPLLCVSFISDNMRVIKILLRNIKVSQGLCDWLVIVYTDINREILELVRQSIPEYATVHIKLIATENKNPMDVIYKYINKTSSVAAFNTVQSASKEFKLIPKPVLYLYLLESNISQYDRVWINDDDVEFTNVDMKELLITLDQGFRNSTHYDPKAAINHINSSAPLISQLTVQRTPDRINYRNDDFLDNNLWVRDIERNRVYNTTRMIPTNFIELMTPIFDSGYLEWFIHVVVIPLLPPIIILASDWGMDHVSSYFI